MSEHPHHWRAVSEPLPLIGARIHVEPVGDLREHEWSPDCWCRPTQDVEQPSVWVHYALDGREAFEDGMREVS